MIGIMLDNYSFFGPFQFHVVFSSKVCSVSVSSVGNAAAHVVVGLQCWNTVKLE